MLICPDCRKKLEPKSSCISCSWNFKKEKNISNYLRTKLPSTISAYIECYNHISEDDLSESIMPKEYLNYQSAKLLTHLSKNKLVHVCDIGGGQGFLAKACKEKGYKNITIIDIAIPYLHRLSNEFNCIIADAEHLPFSEEFDVVFATDVLEHVLNVGSFLYCAHESIKEGGRLVIRVPYRENLMSYSTHLGCKYDFVHLRSFNKDLLKKQLSDAGFLIEKIYYDGYWVNSCRDFAKKGIFETIWSNLREKITKENYVIDNTLVKNILCRFFLRPFEIVCLAKKVNN
jgi:SAM-dependent methyltransferase